MKTIKPLMISIIFILTSCSNYSPVNNQTVTPNSITSELNSYDTTNLKKVYVLADNEHKYVYDENKLLIEKYSITNNTVGLFILICSFIVILGLALFMIIEIN
jgi:PBP1b-binding outer membrane lipoprotein LpoB